MVARYAEQLPAEERAKILFPTQKMVIGVGAEEVATLEKRYTDLNKSSFPIFKNFRVPTSPTLNQKWSKDEVNKNRLSRSAQNKGMALILSASHSPSSITQPR